METTAQTETATRGSAPAAGEIHAANRADRERYLALAAALGEATGADADALTREILEVGTAFVQRNAGLALSVAKRFSHADTAAVEDYAQTAIAALWEAFLAWDPDKATFGTWSRPFLSGDVRRAVARAEFDGLSYTDFTARAEVLVAVADLTEQLGRTPSHDEVAARTGHTAALVARVRQARPASLDTPVGDGESSLADLVAAPDVPATAWVDGPAEDHAWVAYLRDVTARLDARELYLVLRREGLDGAEPQTLVEIASEVGLGREILRRSEVRAREKLAGPLPRPL